MENNYKGRGFYYLIYENSKNPKTVSGEYYSLDEVFEQIKYLNKLQDEKNEPRFIFSIAEAIDVNFLNS